MNACKIVLLFLFVLCDVYANAQMQQGVVKTKGRMVNGKHVTGQGLSGATITIQGRSSVLSQGSGAFSFPVTNKTFMIQGVQKRGYQLVDADAVPKAYQYSTNTFYLVMETPEQQAEDKLAAERKIRRTLQRQLQQREDELDELKEKLTQEEFHRRLAQLYEDQKNNEKLIADMAKEYSQIDYDQLDELNRQISDAILNGELMRADSLLRSKGDINSRIASVRKAQEAEAKEEVELAHRQENLAASKVGTKKRLEDLAQDCKNYFDRYKMSNQHDSATYYIELRAELDTTNAKWQFDAGYYLNEQKQHQKAIAYYTKALFIYRCLAQANPQSYEPDLAVTLNNLALLYSNTQRFSESESLFKEALETYRRLTQTASIRLESGLARTLNNLALLYFKTQRFSESESMFKEAQAIYRNLSGAIPRKYVPYLAWTLNNLANLYRDTRRFSESEEMYNLTLSRLRYWHQIEDFEPYVAGTLNNLADLYRDTRRFLESETKYKEALEIYRRLATKQPDEYRASLAWVQYSLMHIYSDNEQIEKYDSMLTAALANYEVLYKSDESEYEAIIVELRNRKGWSYLSEGDVDEAMKLFESTYAIDPKSSATYLAYGCNEKAYAYARVGYYTRALNLLIVPSL